MRGKHQKVNKEGWKDWTKQMQAARVTAPALALLQGLSPAPAAPHDLAGTPKQPLSPAPEAPKGKTHSQGSNQLSPLLYFQAGVSLPCPKPLVAWSLSLKAWEGYIKG